MHEFYIILKSNSKLKLVYFGWVWKLADANYTNLKLFYRHIEIYFAEIT